MSATPNTHPPTTMPKKCSVCGDTKSPSEFYVNWRLIDGVRDKCKTCDKAYSVAWGKKHPQRAAYHHKNTNLKAKYGITMKEFDTMWTRQNGRCASCSETLIPGFKTQVDHHHGHGTVRSLLCGDCNVALGRLENRPGAIWGLIAYMDQHGIVADVEGGVPA